jgi:UDP-3-O-[3-hydroxymyristoyl] glucosamine N-acyltransferase
MATGTPQRLADLAGYLEGELIGDGERMIARVASLESAAEGDISFITHARFRPQLASCRASAVIVPPALAGETSLPRVVCAEPYLAYARAARRLSAGAPVPAGVHPSAVVEQGAQVATDAAVGAGAYIGRGAIIGPRSQIGAGSQVGAGCNIGSACVLHARVTLYPGCTLGDRCIVHSGAVIGADGFGFAPERGAWLKIPQTGGVLIGDDVEIGANTTIDRGALDDTVIENGVKLDNQIQVAHNVRIGAHTAIAAMTGIAGSASIGKHCMIGGAVRILGHISITDGVEIAATTYVSKSIVKAGKYSGALPFAPTASWFKVVAWIKNLDKLAERIKALEKKLGHSRD